MKKKLTKRQFVHRIYRRNAIIAAIVALTVATLTSIETETSPAVTALCVFAFEGMVLAFTGMWAGTESDEAYRDYARDFEERREP